jgi:hypothetical protein
MWRRELLRRFMTAMRPEEHFEEKIKSQTYTIIGVPKSIIDDLEATCRSYGGTMPSVLPKPKETPPPAKPPSEIDPTIRKMIAVRVGLKEPPPENIQSTEDFKKLDRDEKIKVCKKIFEDPETIEEIMVVDPEIKNLYDFNLKQVTSTIAEKKKKPVEKLTRAEIREAIREAKETTYLQACGSRIDKYFLFLARPDMLEIYLDPTQEKKPLEKIVCTLEEPKWHQMRNAIKDICEKAREHIREKLTAFRWEVEAIFHERKGEEYRPFIHVIDEAYPNVLEPWRIPAHKVTIKMKLGAMIRVPKDKLRKAIDYLKTYRPSTVMSIKTDKDLEREIILTLFNRIENRVNDLLRHTCTPDIRDEYTSLHPKQIKMFKEIYNLVMSRYLSLLTGTETEEEKQEIMEKAYELAKKDLVKWTEELITTRDEEIRKMFAEMLATKALEVAGRTIFETLPTEPVCPPRVTVDIIRRKEREVTLPSLLTAGYRIVEELKTLEVEIEVEQLELRIEFCTPWCSAIDCVLRNITPDYIMDEIVREAKRLGFVEVIIPYPSPSPG